MSKKEKLETRVRQLESEIKNLERAEYSKALEKKVKDMSYKVKHPYRSKFRAFIKGEAGKLQKKGIAELKKFRKRRKGKKRKLF